MKKFFLGGDLTDTRVCKTIPMRTLARFQESPECNSFDMYRYKIVSWIFTIPYHQMKAAGHKQVEDFPNLAGSCSRLWGTFNWSLIRRYFISWIIAPCCYCHVNWEIRKSPRSSKFIFQAKYLDFVGVTTLTFDIGLRRPGVNYAKDWLDQFFLFPGLVWSVIGYHLWMWELWDSQQPFSWVLGHLRHGDDNRTTGWS